MSTRLLWSAAAIAAIATLSTPALGQALDPQAGVRAASQSLSIGAGEAATATWVVTNAGPVQATATVTLRVPAGWSAALPPGDASFGLAPGATRTVAVPVRAAAEAPAGAQLTLAATMTDQGGRTSAPASAPVALAFVPAPVPPPAANGPSAAAVAAAIGGLAVIAFAVAAVAWARRAAPVALFVDPQQRPISTGTDGVFLVEVQNLDRVRRAVELQVGGLPADWYGAFSFPQVVLQPGERSPVPLCIKVPREAGDGVQVDVTLRARASHRSRWSAQARTRIEAHDRVRIGPERPQSSA